MDFLIRSVQMHEDFRLAEIQALGVYASINIKVIYYSKTVRLPHLYILSAV